MMRVRQSGERRSAPPSGIAMFEEGNDDAPFSYTSVMCCQLSLGQQCVNTEISQSFLNFVSQLGEISRFFLKSFSILSIMHIHNSSHKEEHCG